MITATKHVKGRRPRWLQFLTLALWALFIALSVVRTMTTPETVPGQILTGLGIFALLVTLVYWLGPRDAVVTTMSFVGLLAVCFLLCTLLFYVNDTSTKAVLASRATQAVRDLDATSTALSAGIPTEVPTEAPPGETGAPGTDVTPLPTTAP
ncbi:MAG: hypothetical protein M3328_17575 [Chloroflexota bacterium]|nr:hypothetical protein [Chloroflexota bacterium]